MIVNWPVETYVSTINADDSNDPILWYLEVSTNQ
jgi:hypothetical protein